MGYNIFMKLLCPICNQNLQIKEKAYICPNRHNFDIAKEGYINLYLKNSSISGDSKESIQARTNFLNKNYYLFLRDELSKIINKYQANNLIDLACGEGWYTRSYKCKNKIGIDLAKNALKYASKNDKSSQYILSSIFHTPLEDHCADIVITCFAPVAKEEIVRLLKPDGHFLLVKPGKYHLQELRDILYDTPYNNNEEDIEIPHLNKINDIRITRQYNLKKEELKELFQMTPYYYKTSNKDKEKLNDIDNIDITFSFIISDYLSLF